MDMIGRIRRLHSRKKKSEREIARITGLSRNTVAKWLHGEVDGPPKYRRGEQPNKLTVFHEALKQALKADARRPKHERRTAKALYAEIKARRLRRRLHAASPTSSGRGARAKAKRRRPTPSCRWPSSSARRSSSTGARKAWWWAASTTGRRSRT